MQALAQNGATKTVVLKGKAIEVDLVISNSKGKQFEFDRVAMNTRSGFCLDQMRDDEIIIAPGLIYREMNREVKEA